jgi:hypothetical protein
MLPVVATLLLGAVTIRWLNDRRRTNDVDQTRNVVE